MNELFKLAYFCIEPDRKAMRQNNHLPAPRSLHQTILDLVEAAATILVREIIVRQPLFLGVLNLPEEACLVRRIVAGQHPPAGLIAHLPGAGRDCPGRGGHGFILRVEEGDDLPGLVLCFDFLPALPVGNERRCQCYQQFENLDKFWVH